MPEPQPSEFEKLSDAPPEEGITPELPQPSEFEEAAGLPEEGIIGEFWHFLKTNKKWWLLPILFFLLLFGVLLVLSGSAVAPFIYSLF